MDSIQLPRAKPIILTFYDRLLDYPYTSTFYIADFVTQEQAKDFIHSVEGLSVCVLGKYKIGYEEFLVTDYRDKLKDISPYSFGTSKWRVVVYTEKHKTTSFSIPGRNNNLVTKRNEAELEHPAWKEFLKQFRKLCLAKTGESLQDHIRVEITNGTWPPKGAKKR